MNNKNLYNSFKIFKRQLNKYNRLQGELKYIENRYELERKCYDKVLEETENNYAKLTEELKNKFPDNEQFVLPTSFGNTIRAFEVYPRVVYGLDSIPSWYRILAFVPTDYRDYLNSAKAQVDFSVNLFYFTILLAIESLIFIILNDYYILFYVPLIFLIFSLMMYRLAIDSAFEWGQFVKSIFDLYRHDLLSKMKIKIPRSQKREKKYFEELSQMFLFWDEIDIERDIPKKEK